MVVSLYSPREGHNFDAGEVDLPKIGTVAIYGHKKTLSTVLPTVLDAALRTERTSE